MFDVIALTDAARLASEEARSALPNAPTHPTIDPPTRPRRADGVRTFATSTLRRLADRIEPRTRRETAGARG